jgi:hypothetical protein
MENKICQSCGMPMTKPEDFGTNADGSPSVDYCHYCFQNGKFIDEGITLEEKIAKNIAIAKKMGMPEGEAEKMAKGVLPGLKRWKK